MVISASLQACGVVFPFATLTSICRSIVTICSGLYLLIGMASFSSKWILSHSTWYKFRRSRQQYTAGWRRIHARKSILIIEEDYQVRELFVRLVMAMDFAVVTA